MNGRRIYWPRGKTLGGSSSINGLIYIRGQREDYDHWAALGNAGWGYDDVLPYFIRPKATSAAPMRFHGADGPLKVSDIGAKHELIEAFIARRRASSACRAPTTSTARAQEGAGYYQLTTAPGLALQHRPRPISSRRRTGANLRIETDAHGRRPGVRRPARGRRALPARRRDEDRALPRRGAALPRARIQSPQLLQLSGIGPRALLAAVAASPSCTTLPGVGENLQDHLQIRLELRVHASRSPPTTSSTPGRPGEASGMQWLLQRTGPLAIGINQGGCFMRALPMHGNRWPPRPTSSSTSPRCRPTWPAARCIRTRASRCRSASCGRSRAATSASARSTRSSRPRCSRTTSSTELDRATAVAGVKAARAIAASPRDAALREARGQARPRCGERRRAARVLPQQRRHDLPSHRHLPDGQRRRSRSSMRACACTASAACASSTARPCRRWCRATPMRRR